jgi:hypothetical protein
VIQPAKKSGIFLHVMPLAGLVTTILMLRKPGEKSQFMEKPRPLWRPGILVLAPTGKDGLTVKRLIALLVLVAAMVGTTLGCGSEGTTKKTTPTSTGATEKSTSTSSTKP